MVSPASVSVNRVLKFWIIDQCSDTPLVAFTINRIRDTPTYNVNGVPARFDDAMDDTQVSICMDPRDIPTLNEKLQNSTLPYVELFNEPDYSYGGFTPLTSPQNASSLLRPILNSTHSTKFISPAPAGTGGSYLTNFNSSCPECMEKLDYIGAHVYSVEAQGAIDMVTALHDKWKKDIWVTELSPASGAGQGCEYNVTGMKNWMNTTVSGLQKLDYVKRIFWNQGEWVSVLYFFSSSSVMRLLTSLAQHIIKA